MSCSFTLLPLFCCASKEVSNENPDLPKTMTTLTSCVICFDFGEFQIVVLAAENRIPTLVSMCCECCACSRARGRENTKNVKQMPLLRLLYYHLLVVPWWFSWPLCSRFWRIHINVTVHIYVYIYIYTQYTCNYMHISSYYTYTNI